MLHRIGTRALLGAAALACASLAAHPAAASSYKVLYNFCSQSNCTDGEDPMAPVTSDAAGNLYGLTFKGGANAAGVVYRLAPNGNHGYDYSVLYNFCALADCADGEEPGPEHLVLDTQGNLYGTNTSVGGGTVFELSPDADPHKLWHLTTLHNFCANANSCADGNTPFGALSYLGSDGGALYDGSSPLYGTTLDGGPTGGGVVFSLTPGGAESVLYGFCAVGKKCSDGAGPVGNVIVLSADKLIGTTEGGGGGKQEGGVAFELDRSGSTWSETVLHKFCLRRCTDGKNPDEAGITIDGAGTIYGVADDFGPDGHGTAFRLVPDGASYRTQTLADFCQAAECLDGSLPNGGLMVRSGTTLYGTTLTGGNRGQARDLAGDGVLFKLRGHTLDIVYKFCTQNSCTDGNLPNGGLIADGSGHLLGTTRGGGTNDGGVVYAFTP
jgi:uncharacterized repeat protein (TIGR03803 family)